MRRFHREIGPALMDLLDLSRAESVEATGRRKLLLEQISALANRVNVLAAPDAKLPPLPGGVGNAIMAAFSSRRRGFVGIQAQTRAVDRSGRSSSHAARTRTTSRTSHVTR